jgi:hypothetical protein
MRPRTISTFWIGYCLGLLCLSPAWAARDEPPAELHSAEQLSMEQWLKLPEVQRVAIVQSYAQRKPPTRYTDTTERRRQEAA